MGCDHELGSKAVSDACGVCKGDNSTCKFYKGLYLSQHKANGKSCFYSPGSCWQCPPPASEWGGDCAKVILAHLAPGIAFVTRQGSRVSGFTCALDLKSVLSAPQNGSAEKGTCHVTQPDDVSCIPRTQGGRGDLIPKSYPHFLMHAVAHGYIQTHAHAHTLNSQNNKKIKLLIF